MFASLVLAVIDERRFLISIIESQLKKQVRMQKELQNMQGQAEMMTSLMRDLMNEAQLKNNTFAMVNDYFNFIKLVKKCFKTLKIQCSFKKIYLMGPILENPIERYFFQHVFGDERRYA